MNQDSINVPKQKQLNEINWSNVIDLAQGEVDVVASGDYFEDSDDTSHFIYEEVMKAIFGDDYFEWMNKHL